MIDDMELSPAKIKAMQKAFHSYWETAGQPHPNSNKYLAMVKAFYFAEGFKHGIETAAKAEANTSNETVEM